MCMGPLYADSAMWTPHCGAPFGGARSKLEPLTCTNKWSEIIYKRTAPETPCSEADERVIKRASRIDFEVWIQTGCAGTFLQPKHTKVTFFLFAN